MKFSYKFSNLLGTVYKSGDVLFSSDGNTVICPVGNKISLYDLAKNHSITLPIEARYNYTTLALSPNGKLLLASDEDGELHVINLHYRNIMYKKRFNQPIKIIKFSPDGKFFALNRDEAVFIYNSPGSNRHVFNPFNLERIYSYSTEDVNCIDWSSDARFLAYGSSRTHICPLKKMKNMFHYTISSRHPIVGVFFEKHSLNLVTVSKVGLVSQHTCSLKLEELIEFTKDDIEKTNDNSESESDDVFPETQEEKENNNGNKLTRKESTEEKEQCSEFFYEKRSFVSLDKHLKDSRASVRSCSYNKNIKLLCASFTNGDFLLVDMTDNGDVIHSLNISNEAITNCCLNPSGDWLALGVSSLGQLVVWEWQSETYVLKQQSHTSNCEVVCYSPDGSSLCSGGHDGKLKLWSAQSGFCLVTFTEHSAPITGVTFTQSGKAILSASLDGTVRAFDVMRYRNFKTLTSPVPAQFSCLAVDSCGELVAAGATDQHDIYLWSLKTGRLLEILGGHRGPVSSLQFSAIPGSTSLVSTAWDRTLKVWDAISTTTAKESIAISADGLGLCLRPDGEQVAVSTTDGHITFFNPVTGQQESCIEGRHDLGSGRADSDKITAKSNLKGKAFTTLCYSADGKYILAAGQSKNVCIYSVDGELLIKRFEVTQNRSFDAMDEVINRRKMAENDINMSIIEDRGSGFDTHFDKAKIKLPGVRSGDLSQRSFRPEVQTTSIVFSPTGRSWAACTSEGLLIYSLDNDFLFDPLKLEEGQTPEYVRKTLKEKKYSSALMVATKLNLTPLVQEVIESIPIDSMQIVLTSLPQFYVESMLKFLSSILETTRHLGLYMKWTVLLLRTHGQTLKGRAPELQPILNQLQSVIVKHNTNMGKVSNHNGYMLKYFISQGFLRQKKAEIKDESTASISKNDGEGVGEEEDDELENLFEDNASDMEVIVQ